MFLLIFSLIFFASYGTVNAQIPLFYQLLEAYKSPTYQTITPSIVTPTPGKILGISTTAPTPIPTKPPVNVGGDGRVITIAVLGDSMIDTLQPGLPQLDNALKQYFPGQKFRLLNYGVGGRNIEYGLFRLTNDYEYLGNKVQSLVSQNPDIVVVESFAYNNFGNSEDGINRHWFAATIAPNSVTFGNGIKDVHFSALEKLEKSNTIKLYLQNATNFATSQGFPLADAYHPSLFGNDGLQDFINAGDNLHPSGPGGVFFCDTIADTIAKNKLIE
jgi:hypothetical protein